MLKKVLAFTCLTLSIGANADSLDFGKTYGNQNALFGISIAIDTPECDITACYLYLDDGLSSALTSFDVNETGWTTEFVDMYYELEYWPSEPNNTLGSFEFRATYDLLFAGDRVATFDFQPDFDPVLTCRDVTGIICTALGVPFEGLPLIFTKFEVIETVVPLPAAAWLFGSALVGLVGVGRRKKAQV